MKLQRKSMVVILLVLALNLTATALKVQADAGGVGKFLTITIVGGGSVTATKVNSGQTWVFPPCETEKVGAGTILLEAVANPGWEFYRWEGDLSGNSNTTEYKTEKNGNVTARFVKITYTITAIAYGPGTINNTNWLEVEVEHGAASPLFVFAPTDPTLYDITLIKVDGNYTGYTTSYAFPDPITSDHDIEVTFDDIGVAAVPDDINVRSLIDSIASAMFDNTEGGTIIGIALPFPNGTALFLYEIATNATDADGTILLAFQLGSKPVAVIKGPTADAIYSDVDNSGYVDGTDVSLVANAVKSTTGSQVYLAEYDTNRDGVVNEEDVHTVNENKGTTLTVLIENVDWWFEDGILYILNPNNDWSGFRAI